MARCFQLTPEQSEQWREGSWPSIELENDVFDWAYRHNIREEIIVVTSDKKIAFAMTADQRRA
jgi:hypothetical protein